eukprot:jgi/Mesvir1/26205/Mv02389-RA.1
MASKDPQARNVRRLEYREPFAAEGIVLNKHGGSAHDFLAFVNESVKTVPALAKADASLADKVVLVGDQAVGKTSLMVRYFHGAFTDRYKATIGVDFAFQKFDVAGLGYTMHVWDTAGQEKFRSLSQSYYRGARACIACFDLGLPASLTSVKAWVNEVVTENQKATAGDTKDVDGKVFVFLVGCKADAYHVVPKEDGLALAHLLGAEYFEVSARTGDNISWLFERIGSVLFEHALLRAIEAKTTGEREARAGWFYIYAVVYHSNGTCPAGCCHVSHANRVVQDQLRPAFRIPPMPRTALVDGSNNVFLACILFGNGAQCSDNLSQES